jgi:uncharacterized protein YndB with AHSA1/START domain
VKIVLVLALGLFVAAVLACIVTYVAGTQMPREHHSQLTATFPVPRDKVWNVLIDYEGMPKWWPAVKSVRTERLTDGTLITWNKDAHGNEVPFKTTAMNPDVKLERTIAGTNQPFGGKWTFELADDGDSGTKLTLTEDGWIQSPFYRAIAKWFVGLDATQKDFIANLTKRLASEKI